MFDGWMNEKWVWQKTEFFIEEDDRMHWAPQRGGKDFIWLVIIKDFMLVMAFEIIKIIDGIWDKKIMTNLYKSLPIAKHYAECFTYAYSTHKKVLWNCYSYNFHFIDEETEAQRGLVIFSRW